MSIQKLIPYSDIKLFEDIYHLLQSHRMMMDLFFFKTLEQFLYTREPVLPSLCSFY